MGPIRWVVSDSARADIADVRELRGEDGYKIDVYDLRMLLRGYFEATPGCSIKLGKSICPLGGTTSGGKVLKVRWKYPGGGKSGGLRLCVAAFCDDRLVVVCHASMRRDVDDQALMDSATGVDRYIAGADNDDDNNA